MRKNLEKKEVAAQPRLRYSPVRAFITSGVRSMFQEDIR
jgi:hypothetical protein